MHLISFRVTDFRSVDDSGWIDTDRVSALIGTNESGKTNVLRSSLEAQSGEGGAIEPPADYPRERYHEIAR
jgi:AAA15 family ATPase/GTPase